MANRIVNLYVRIGDGRAFLVNADNIKLNPAQYPVIHYSEILEVHLRPLNEDGTAWTLAELDTFGSYKFGLDEDFNRSTTPWALTTSNFTTNKYLNTIGDPAFGGTGLDDVISSGTFTGTTSATYTIKIDTAAATDKFQWRKDSGAWTTGVSITASAQTLSEGVAITFNVVTGHTLNDTWTIEGTTAGELYCDANAFNTTYDSGIGTREAVDGNAEWQFLNSTNVDLLIQVPWILKASLIDPGDSPPGPASQYTLAANNPPIVTSDPTGGDLREGLLWFNSTDDIFRCYANSTVYNLNMTEKP